MIDKELFSTLCGMLEARRRLFCGVAANSIPVRRFLWRALAERVGRTMTQLVEQRARPVHQTRASPRPNARGHDPVWIPPRTMSPSASHADVPTH
jgi:hypothetical protein